MKEKKEKILLAGDSWFAGCWSLEGEIIHPGIEEFLRKRNYIVKNIALGGSDNIESANRLYELSQEIDINEYHVLAVFTDPLRKYNNKDDDGIKILSNDFCESVTTKQQFLEKYIQEVHKDLCFYNTVAQKCNITVTLFGGLCEIKEDYLKDYNNLKLGMTSWQKFIDPELNIPEVARGDWQYLISYSSKECLVELAEKIHNFYWDTLRFHPEFQPDGSHPGIQSHMNLAYYIDNLIKNDKYICIGD